MLGFVDYAVVAVFLVATLGIGLWAGRGVRTIEEYATGNRSFGTEALAITLLATKISGINVIKWIMVSPKIL